MTTTSEADESLAVAAIEECYARGWSDGLPLVPPTARALDAMLAASGRDPDELLGLFPPQHVELRVRDLALYALMAGCEPSAMPLLVGVVHALLDKAFNLFGVATSTAGAAPLLIVNGPIRTEAGLNSGTSLFGPGFRTNATVGRTVRLLLRNVGGAIPGVLDHAALANPGRYSYCMAEDEEASPWPPFHVSRGFDADQSVVTVYAAHSPHTINNNQAITPESLLWAVSDRMSGLGAQNTGTQGQMVVVLGPAHAATVAEHGWSREDTQRFLWNEARRSIGELRMVGRVVESTTILATLPGDSPDDLVERPAGELPDGAMAPATPSAADVLILVAGGQAGRISVCMPAWSDTRTTNAVSVAITSRPNPTEEA